MSTFTPSHLGKWEELYQRLLSPSAMPLNPDVIWMLGNKPGLVAVMDAGEAVYIEGVADIGKALTSYLSGAAECDFRTRVAIVELGASPRTASERAKKGPLAERVNKAIRGYSFNVVPATASTVEALASAFRVVADPRFNGPTAWANAVLDALPR